MGWENVRTWLLAAVATLAILSALYLARPAPTHADGPTLVSGIISTPTTWTASGSPYIVTGNILVTRTVTLTVEPGVTVKFDGPYYLRVDGALKAIGTPSQPITFTSNKASPASGDWDSIRFYPGSAAAIYDSSGNYVDGSTLQYVTAEYSGAARSVPGSATVEADGDAAPYIMGSTIRRGSGWAIYVESGAARIISNTVEDNNRAFGGSWGGAVRVGGPATVLYNTIRNNIFFGGISVFQGPALVAHNSIMSNTRGYYGGVYVNEGSATILNNTISGNSEFGVHLFRGSATISSNTISGNNDPPPPGGGGSGVYLVDSSATIVSNAISGNFGPGVVLWNSSLTASGNTISGNSGAGIRLVGSPPSTSPNTLLGNTIMSNTVGGIAILDGSAVRISSNTIVGNRGTGYTPNGAGVLIGDRSLAVIEGNVIRGNVAAGKGGGIYSSGTVTLTLNDVSDNVATSGGGLYLAGGSSRLSFNNITGNTPTALHNAAAGQVSAPYNYWGTTDTSAIDAAIYDFYDDFDKGIVSYTPFLTQPISFPLRYTYLPVIARNRASGW